MVCINVTDTQWSLAAENTASEVRCPCHSPVGWPGCSVQSRSLGFILLEIGMMMMMTFPTSKALSVGSVSQHAKWPAEGCCRTPHVASRHGPPLSCSPGLSQCGPTWTSSAGGRPGLSPCFWGDWDRRPSIFPESLGEVKWRPCECFGNAIGSRFHVVPASTLADGNVT